MITQYSSLVTEHNYFNKKRNTQNTFWLHTTIKQQLKDTFYQNSRIKKALQQEVSNLENGKTTPFRTAKRLLEL